MNTHRPKLGHLLQQRRLHRHNQMGFIQAALLFGIALMTAILGGFALANRSPTSQTDVEQAKVNASVVLKQGSDLRDGVGRYATDNGSSAVLSTMDFSTTASVGLFEVAARYASPQIMPTSAFAATVTNAAPSASAAGHWFLNKATEGPLIGLSGGTDYDPMVLLPNLRLDVCQRINRLLYGSATIPTVANALTAVTGATTLGAFSSAADRWPEGCVSTSDTKYVYFKVVQEN